MQGPYMELVNKLSFKNIINLKSVSDINNKIDTIEMNSPNSSINLLIRKFDMFSNIFFISIKMNQINHFVSFNNYC